MKKDRLINRNPNLTLEQKSGIIELLGKHPSYENKIDWNKSNSLTYEDFLKVLRPLYINELDPRGLVKGQDYDVLYESNGEVLYSVYTYEASVVLASNSVMPKLWTELPKWCGKEEKTDEAHAFGYFDPEHGNMKPGAKWCISMRTSDKHWEQYTKNFHFYFWFRSKLNLKNSRKIVIGVYKNNWQVGVSYNGVDEDYRLRIPPYIMEAISKDKERAINRIKSGIKLNPSTNRYDYNGDLDNNIIKCFVSEDRDGFTIDFGEVTGNFDCSLLRLTSLKGAPQKVGGDFICCDNSLSSLKGAPKEVGKSFWCNSNKLTSLIGAPQEIRENFNCSYNKLTSLEGAPQKVGGKFDCHFNGLTSLMGSPQRVDGNFYCSENKLTSLKGSPQEVGGHFDCLGNRLISLEGAPQKVGGFFDCSYNQLNSLEGAPKEVGGSFGCEFNKLTSLEGVPKEVGGDFKCDFNKLSSLEGASQEVGWSFDCSDNCLTSLVGAPQKVGRNFDCSNNPNLHSLDGIGKVKGKIYKDF